jgi:hypothetical protein
MILGSESHGTHDQIVLSDGSGRLLLLALASTVILDSEFHGTHDHILLSDCSGNLHTAWCWVWISELVIFDPGQ